MGLTFSRRGNAKKNRHRVLSIGTAGSQQRPTACCHCTCCACCIAPPARAVLYDDDLDEVEVLKDKHQGSDDAAETWIDNVIRRPESYRGSSCDTKASGDKDLNSSASAVNGLHLPVALMSLACAPQPSPAKHDGTKYQQMQMTEQASTRPASLMPSLCAPAAVRPNMPNIPGLSACLSAGINARALLALRAHLSAKGFAVEGNSVAHVPGNIPTLSTPVQTATKATSPSNHGHNLRAWHSVGRHSRAYRSRLANSTLENTASAPVQIHSYTGQPSPGHASRTCTAAGAQQDDQASAYDEAASMFDPDIDDDRDHELDPHAVEEYFYDDDCASVASYVTACSPHGPISTPVSRHQSLSHPTQSQDLQGSGFPHHDEQTHDAHLEHQSSQQAASVKVSGHSQHTQHGHRMTWHESVHLAQELVAQEDLAHIHGSNQHPALLAFKQGTLGWAFSGGGFFFPYHLGCVIQLKDMGIITDRTPLAGASCGSIITACVNAGLDLHKLVDKLLEFAADCRTYGTMGRLRSVIFKFMTANLPADAHLRCRDRTYISLTKVFPFLRPKIISDFSSRDDLVEAIATSCHIPAFNDGSLMARFRDGWYVDGGVLRHIPHLPPESRMTHVAGISCVPLKFIESVPGVSRLQLLASMAVSPDMFGTFPFNWSDVGGLILYPAEDPVLLQMVEMGKKDIIAWAAAVGLSQHLAGMDWVPKQLNLMRPSRKLSSTAGSLKRRSRTPQHGHGGHSTRRSMERHAHQVPEEEEAAALSAEEGKPLQIPTSPSIQVPPPISTAHTRPGNASLGLDHASSSSLYSSRMPTAALGSSPRHAPLSSIAAAPSVADTAAHAPATPSRCNSPCSSTCSTATVGDLQFYETRDEDWHDAVEQQADEHTHDLMHAVHAVRAEDAGKQPQAAEVLIDGLAAVAEAVHGPLHMNASQAVQTLGGYGALGLVSHSAFDPPPKQRQPSHTTASDRRPASFSVTQERPWRSASPMAPGLRPLSPTPAMGTNANLQGAATHSNACIPLPVLSVKSTSIGNASSTAAAAAIDKSTCHVVQSSGSRHRLGTDEHMVSYSLNVKLPMLSEDTTQQALPASVLQTGAHSTKQNSDPRRDEGVDARVVEVVTEIEGKPVTIRLHLHGTN